MRLQPGDTDTERVRLHNHVRIQNQVQVVSGVSQLLCMRQPKIVTATVTQIAMTGDQLPLQPSLTPPIQHITQGHDITVGISVIDQIQLTV